MGVSHNYSFALFHIIAAAKSLQSCLTLYDPIDSSPPGSAVPGILQQLTTLTAASSRLIKGDLFL